MCLKKQNMDADFMGKGLSAVTLFFSWFVFIMQLAGFMHS